MLKYMFKQHVRQQNSDIVGVIKQFIDKTETELAERAEELSNY